MSEMWHKGIEEVHAGNRYFWLATSREMPYTGRDKVGRDRKGYLRR